MKSSFGKILLGAFLGLLGLQVTAQTELKNKVSDFLTFMPIESASVYVQNTTIGTVTNIDGKFVNDNVTEKRTAISKNSERKDKDSSKRVRSTSAHGR